ncbi:hypothetical protein OH77DRAFT_1068 [Trametes cingulata]|nr:hypothetical protein OH77DRAFT_1068 [Trametes cingulata]
MSSVVDDSAFMTSLSSLEGSEPAQSSSSQPDSPPATLSGTVTMFDRVFKKKDESSYTDLTRRSRVDKAAEYAGKRPRTAPASPNTTSYGETDKAAGLSKQRHSLGEGILSSHRATPEPFFEEPASFAFLPPPTPVSNEQMNERTPRSSRQWDDSPCPRMAPEAPTGSNELRNPFRSSTNDSISSVGRTDSFESLADTGVPVHRTVRSFRPAQTIEDARHQPQKAAIFTVGVPDGPLDVPSISTTTTSNPFTDTHDASAPASPTGGMSRSPLSTSGTTSPRSGSRRWSLLRSPRRGSYDFLQVKIPTGLMSPVRESRLAFWSKA